MILPYLRDLRIYAFQYGQSIIYHIEVYYWIHTPLVPTTRLRQGVTEWIGIPVVNILQYG